MEEKVRNLKKIELHLHLDGSINIDTIKKLTNMDIDTIKKEVIANDKCHDLGDYLTRFDLPISLMQTKENLELVANDLVNYLEKQNVIYAEIRFAPMFHTKKGLSYEDVIDAVLKGIKKNNKVKTNLILCMMRGFSKEDNLKTLEVCKKYLNKGVCALDLAGDETKYPLQEYGELFELAKENNIPFTIHAGESESFEEIDKAISLGAKRIGHGIQAISSENTLNSLKEKDIMLEICPTSNIQTNVIDTYNNHPIFNLYQNNIPLNINTDNTTVSNITLNDEYIKLMNEFNFTIEDLEYLNFQSINYCFLSDLEKEELRQIKKH